MKDATKIFADLTRKEIEDKEKTKCIKCGHECHCGADGLCHCIVENDGKSSSIKGIGNLFGTSNCQCFECNCTKKEMGKDDPHPTS